MIQIFQVLDRPLLSGIGNKAFTAKVFLVAKLGSRHKQLEK
jgi:hypothetical protein